MSDQQPKLRKTLGPLMLWGLGVGYLISGMYFGWNLGLEKGGTMGLAIATGFIIIMCTAIFSGLAYISIRKIGNRDHPVVIVNYFMTFGAVVSGFIAIPMWVQPQGSEWILAGSLGVIGFVAQYFMTRAFQIAHTYVVAPMKYVEMVFTVLLGMMLLGERYSMYSFLGTLLIVGGLLLNIRFSTVGASKKKSI